MKSMGQRSEKYRELVIFVDERKVREITLAFPLLDRNADEKHLQLDVSD